MNWKNIFGINDDNDPVVEEPPAPQPIVKQDYRKDVLFPMVLAEEKRIRDNQDTMMSQYTDNHEKAIREFEFSCIRHGDFLTLFFTRSTGKVTETVNLGLVNKIIKYKGSAPGLTGYVVYRVNKTRDDGQLSHGGLEYLSRRTESPPPPGITVSIASEIVSYEDNDNHERLVILSYRSPYRDYDDAFDYITENAPVPATDDVIEFRGIDQEYRIPFGLGDFVRTKILDEIERGFEHKGIVGKPSQT